MLVAVVAHVTLLCASAVYSRLLASVHRRYPQTYIRFLWITVAGGYVLTWATYSVSVWGLGPLAWWQHSLLYLGGALVAGLPIIWWQWHEDNAALRSELKRTNGGRHGH
jgi:hypothetical protein